MFAPRGPAARRCNCDHPGTPVAGAAKFVANWGGNSEMFRQLPKLLFKLAGLLDTQWLLRIEVEIARFGAGFGF